VNDAVLIQERFYISQPPNLQIINKVKKLSEIAEALRQGSRFHVTRLTIFKSLCAQPEAPAAFALFLALKLQKKMRNKNLANDPEGADLVCSDFDIISEILGQHGLPAHEEPTSLPGLHDRSGTTGFPYSFLHYLRRFYARGIAQTEQPFARRLYAKWFAQPMQPPTPVGHGEDPSTDLVLIRSHRRSITFSGILTVRGITFRTTFRMSWRTIGSPGVALGPPCDCLTSLPLWPRRLGSCFITANCTTRMRMRLPTKMRPEVHTGLSGSSG
jgi:hypothetical protein